LIFTLNNVELDHKVYMQPSLTQVHSFYRFKIQVR